MNQRLQQFRKALVRLEEVLNLREEDEIIRDSAIQRFEFTFDLAWKSLKDYIREVHGLECASPKSCIRLAFSLGLIEHDEYWLKICDFRNLTSHTYNEDLAEKIYRELPKVLEYFKRLYRIIS